MPKAKKKAKAQKTKRPAPKAKPPKRPSVAAVPPDARFDRRPYEPLPLLDGSDAVALAKALLAKKPGKLPEADRLASVLAKARGAVGEDARSHDVAMDRAWLAFVRRVHDYA
ncbi:MAG TPA: hypothetical protein VIF62_35420, partial [Labilithrix sp.]